MKRARAADDEEGDKDTFVEYVAPNTIYYRGEIKEPEATKFIQKLRKAASKLASSASSAPITVYISSFGGDAYSGITMYEHVLMVKRDRPVIFVVDGYCASAATLPLLAASERKMCKHATLLVHAVSSEIWGGFKPKQLKEESENLETLMHILMTIYQTHSTLNKKELRKLLEKDKLLTKDECVKFGFIDP